MKTLSIFVALTLTINADLTAQESRSKREVPADVRVEREVAFLPADRTEKSDLYFPLEMPKNARLPAVIMIHGGGWNGGQRDGNREINVGSTLNETYQVAYRPTCLDEDINRLKVATLNP